MAKASALVGVPFEEGRWEEPQTVRTELLVPSYHVMCMASRKGSSCSEIEYEGAGATYWSRLDFFLEKMRFSAQIFSIIAAPDFLISP